LAKVASVYPDVHLELCVDKGPVDIVATGLRGDLPEGPSRVGRKPSWRSRQYRKSRRAAFGGRD
jgi:hypothetical protein